jgi:hypothetical protein
LFSTAKGYLKILREEQTVREWPIALYHLHSANLVDGARWLVYPLVKNLDGNDL